MTAPLEVNGDVVAEIAARLDLREPNQLAVQSLANALFQHYDAEGGEPPFEAVIDSATGVGKTYVLAGAMEFLVAVDGVRDFAIITPGRTILDKTKGNLTPGHPKSLLGPMSFSPVVITSDNFNTPAMRAAMDDDTQVKVYLFTVQALIKPDTKVGRKTHKFQEGLGGEFYEQLQKADHLVVFADEHHCYFGPSFSKAVRDLNPWALVGLTATPDKKTPKDQIIFRYPLAAAVADRLVKTPVIVGRKDDRSDALTKLSDGVTLLEAKAVAVQSYCQQTGAPSVNPVMLIVAPETKEADEYGGILRSTEFFGGAYVDAVLVVHSKAPDEALEALDHIEDLDSPVRIVISVGMLKEGWDVKNVYVIASMRASISDVLTEQTLGRGMRLPFGHYTDVELLDTLEVVAHERYQELLNKAGVLNEAFIDYRTRVALQPMANGAAGIGTETTVAASAGVFTEDGSPLDSATPPPGTAPAAATNGSSGPRQGGGAPGLKLTGAEERKAEANQAAAKMSQQVGGRDDVATLQVPVLKTTAVKANFTLADIIDVDPFRKLGLALATDPEAELSRTLVGARVVTGPDGIRRTVTVTKAAQDHVQASTALFPLEDLRARLAEAVLMSPAVPAYKSQRKGVNRLLDAFLGGLGPKAEPVLSANLDRASARLIDLVLDQQRKWMPKPTFDQTVELRDFSPVRVTDRDVSENRYGTFVRSAAYNGWSRSLYALEWFDSGPERDVANALDSSGEVRVWVRLHVGEIPIVWNSDGRHYNPDFLVIETNGSHWLVEAKADKDVPTTEVQAKREAAQLGIRRS